MGSLFSRTILAPEKGPSTPTLTSTSDLEPEVTSQTNEVEDTGSQVSGLTSRSVKSKKSTSTRDHHSPVFPATFSFYPDDLKLPGIRSDDLSLGIVDLHDEKWNDAWILVLGLPSTLNDPNALRSLAEVAEVTHRFNDLGLALFLVNCDFDSFSHVEAVRDELEIRDPGVTFLVDSERELTSKLKVIARTVNEGREFVYPSVFVLTPERELTLGLSLTRSRPEYVTPSLTFSYPVTSADLESILKNVAQQKEVFASMAKMRASLTSYQGMTFGDYVKSHGAGRTRRGSRARGSRERIHMLKSQLTK